MKHVRTAIQAHLAVIGSMDTVFSDVRMEGNLNALASLFGFVLFCFNFFFLLWFFNIKIAFLSGMYYSVVYIQFINEIYIDT